MDIISRYLTRDYLVGFLLTLLVFTFVMCIGIVIRAVDLMSRGVSGLLILRIFLTNMPYVLSFSIPISAITSVLLLFSRLSVDGELTAMKACGLDLWRIIAAPVWCSVLLTVLCLWLNSVVAPNSHFARRQLFRHLQVEDPVSLLEEGRFIRDFPGLLIYIARRQQFELRDIIVYEMDRLGVRRSVRAERGTIRPMEEEGVLLIDLFEVRIDQRDARAPDDMARVRRVIADEYPVRLDFSDIWRRGTVEKRISDMTVPELITAAHHLEREHPELDARALSRHRLRYLVESNKRLALAYACFSFTLLGIPLGMHSRRKESSAGVAVSLGLVLVFYLFILAAESLTGHPQWFPELLIWLPVLGSEALGAFLIQRAN